MLIRKTIRQPVPHRSASIRKPARIGPSTADSPMIGPNGTKAFWRSSGVKLAFTIASPCGIITAPKKPWATRAAMSRPALGARPLSSEAAVKPAMPMMNRRRRPSRSPARALVIRPTAKVSVYAASTHCSVDSLPPRSARMEGPARLAMVASSRSMTSATMTTHRTIHR